MVQAEVRTTEKVFWVNPSFKVTLDDGGVTVMTAKEALLQMPLTFKEEDDNAFHGSMEAFLNEAYAQGWVYYTQIAGAPVFARAVKAYSADVVFK